MWRQESTCSTGHGRRTRRITPWTVPRETPVPDPPAPGTSTFCLAGTGPCSPLCRSLAPRPRWPSWATRSRRPPPAAAEISRHPHQATPRFRAASGPRAAPGLDRRARDRADLPGVRAAGLPQRAPGYGVYPHRPDRAGLAPGRRAGQPGRGRACQPAPAQARPELRPVRGHRIPRRLPVPPPDAVDQRPEWNTSCGTLLIAEKRAPGSVKLRTGGKSPRPVRSQRTAEPVKFRDRR